MAAALGDAPLGDAPLGDAPLGDEARPLRGAARCQQGAAEMAGAEDVAKAEAPSAR